MLVAEPPNIWLMLDKDGDLRMDGKELVSDQFGRLETDPENNANTFYWALDNWMYTAGQTTIQLRLKRGAFEVQKTLQRGEWGVAQDDAGHIYRNTNESALHVDYVPTAYFARNPSLLRTRGSYERLADEDNDAEHRVAGAAEPRARTARTRPASTVPTDRWRGSPPSAPRSCIEATGCRRICMATCSWRSRRRTS